MRSKINGYAFQARVMLKQVTRVLSKRNFYAEKTPNKKENFVNFAPTPCFTSAAPPTDVVLQRFWASYYQSVSIALVSCSGYC